ncbi:MAG TPA: transketolase [Planctomycetota bacterium]|nr:transketolase [Planctomycetota bacterium]
MDAKELELLCINTIRCLAIDAVQKANSGHPGAPMGQAPMAHVLWSRHLRHNPKNPHWLNRDRFILSPGHGCMLLYSLLHLTGYDLPLSELMNFRQLGSKCPGHSEYGHTVGVETTTGPLGQGLANGVGMAMAQKYLAAYFNRPGHEIIDYKILGIVSDGDLMEGVTSEASSLAGHLKLDNIIYLYDDNHISIEGHTSVAFTEDRAKRYEAYGWHVQIVNDGNDTEAINKAIEIAKGVKDKPHIINIRTIIGYGSPNKHDTHEVHGAPLGADEVKLTKKAYGWDPDKQFYIPAEAQTEFSKQTTRGEKMEAEWNAKFAAYEAAYPDLAKQLKDWVAKKLPDGWTDALPNFAGEKSVSTRVAQAKILAAISPKLPMLIGGSADLAPSTSTYVKGLGDFQSPLNPRAASHDMDGGNFGGKNLHFGVREHGMSSVLNGIALSNSLIPYGATFLIFSDYSKPALRLSAFMGVQSIFVFTHDSIGLGEDGPTHQAIEQLTSLRSIYGMTVIRPADATETAVAWKCAIEHRDGPTALILTRQNLPVIDRSKYPAASNVEKGGYILVGDKSVKPDVILLGSGSEVQFCVGAAELLGKDGIKARVVSMPSMEIFDKQPESYRAEILPSDVKARLAVEAAHPMPWYKYIGTDGGTQCMESYGASAPYEALYKKFGFTAENVAAKAKALVRK